MRDRLLLSATMLSAYLFLSSGQSLIAGDASPDGRVPAVQQGWPILVSGALILVGLFWQRRLFQRDRTHGPRRLRVPAAFSAVVFLGFLVMGLLTLHDGAQPDYTADDLIETLGRCLALAVCLLAKSYFAPLFVTGTSSWLIFRYAQHDELEPLPWISNLLDWVFEFSPEWAQAVYWIGICLYAGYTSLHEFSADDLPS